MKLFSTYKLILLAPLLLLNASVGHGAASITLNQVRNGSATSPTNPVIWVTGNAGSSQAHYAEGMSIPYRCVMTGLPIGTQVTLTIGYDIRKNSKHAIDFLTYFDRLLPHTFSNHSTPETIDPLAGTGLSVSSVSIFPIPEPSSAGSPVSGQPGTRFNSLESSERYMIAYNANIDDIYYVSQGSLTAGDAETQVAIKFTPISTSAIIAWGGHIASRTDWGFVSGSPQSAGGISGSPFHTRLVSWSLGSTGNQDLSVAGAAAPGDSYLPVELLSFEANSVGTATELSWTTASEINSDYFTIEKSSSPSEFVQELTKITASGNSTSLKSYQFTDTNPYYPITYYRLKQVDFDGTPHYTNFIASRSGAGKILKTIVYNMQGQMVMETPGAKQNAIDLPTGQYFFYYVGEDGSVYTKHLITSQ